MTVGVYLIRCALNEAFYIGSSTNIEKRWADGHLSPLRNNNHPNPYLQAAWNKYGEASLEFSIIKADVPEDQLKSLEQDYLDGIWSLPGRMNLSRDASSPMRGRRHSPEARAKISAALALRITSEETRRKRSERHKGKFVSAETRAKISASNKGKSMLPQTRAALRAANLGRACTEETKRKIGQANSRP